MLLGETPKNPIIRPERPKSYEKDGVAFKLILVKKIQTLLESPEANAPQNKTNKQNSEIAEYFKRFEWYLQQTGENYMSKFYILCMPQFFKNDTDDLPKKENIESFFKFADKVNLIQNENLWKYLGIFEKPSQLPQISRRNAQNQEGGNYPDFTLQRDQQDVMASYDDLWKFFDSDEEFTIKFQKQKPPSYNSVPSANPLIAIHFPGNKVGFFELKEWTK